MLSFKKTACAVIAACVAIGAAPLAHAQSDLLVATQGHVDAPKVFWEGSANNFTLKTNFGPNPVPIEQSILWVGKGYSSKAQQQYFYEITSDDGDKLAFAGKKGDLLYQAPQNPSANAQDPIWAGFGADTAVPIENFRDQAFTLDMVGFDGPGRMEMFRYGPGWDKAERMLSSHDVGMRSAFMNAGSHTHNNTTFTRPGRYEIMYKATARGNHGVISSTPQKLVWQVGGTKPSPEDLGDVAAAYNASSADESSDFFPKFTLSKNDKLEKDGDDKLTKMTFTTSDASDQGTAVFYIDGYYLAEVPVVDGSAEWIEMIGSQTSNFQVVYVPKSGDSPRWVSAPVSYTTGQATTSTNQLGEFPQKNSQDPAPEFNNSGFSDGSKEVSVSAKTESNKFSNITVQPADDRMTLNVKGGYFNKAEDKYADCDVEFVSSPGHRTYLAPSDGCQKPETTLRLKLIPHPSDYRSGVDFEQGQGGQGSQTLSFGPKDQSQFGSSSKPSENNPESNGNGASAETNQQSNGLDAKQVTINNGHLDIGPVPGESGLQIAIGDDSRQYANKTVLRAPESVNIELNRHAVQIKGPGQKGVFASKSYNFLGDNGTSLWVISGQQINGVPWVGFSTERVDHSEYPNGVNLRIASISAPEGGKWWAFTSDVSDDVQMIASSDKAGEIIAKSPTHMHNNWVFSKPGEYLIGVEAFGTNASGEFKTKQAKIKFTVNGKDDQQSGDTNRVVVGGSSDRSASGSTDGSNKVGQAGGAAPTGGGSAGGSAAGAAKEVCLPVEGASSAGSVATEGHFDLGARIEDGKLVASLKDDRNQPASWVDPASVAFQLGDQAKLKAPDALSFVSKAGQDVWMIQSSQQEGVPWLGFNTMHESIVEQTEGTITWKLDSVEGPGKMAAFTSGTFGGGIGDRIFDNVGGPTSYTVAKNTHMHPNFVFTEAGDYKVSLTATAKGKNGEELSAKTVLNFSAGSEAKVPTVQGSTAKDGKPLVSEDGKKLGRTPSGEVCELGAGNLPSTGAAAGQGAALLAALVICASILGRRYVKP